MKKLLTTVLFLAVITGAAFYGGTKYAKGKAGRNFQNMRAGFGQGTGQNEFSKNAGGRQGSGFIGGEIISKDDKSVTIKLRDNGSKIIFYSSVTEIGKFTSGTVADLEIGKNISVVGKSNSDGSITADSIQIRPTAPVPVPKSTE